LGNATSEYRRGLKEAKKAMFEDSDTEYTAEEREIIKAAKGMGISVENKSVEEIASEILANS